MEKRQVNPWSWQDRAGFSQAWRVDGAETMMFISGQAAITPEGQVLDGDFEAQARLTFENLGTVLERSGASFDSIVKITVFLTDISQLIAFSGVKSEFITGPQPASTAVEVSKLALPDMQIEVEAIAVL